MGVYCNYLGIICPENNYPVTLTKEEKTMVKLTDRVKIWNTFYKLAWTEAKFLSEINTGTKSTKILDPLGAL